MEIFNVKRYAPKQKQIDPEKENKLFEKLQGIIAKKKKLIEDERSKKNPEMQQEPVIDAIDASGSKEDEQLLAQENVSQIDKDAFTILGNEQFVGKERVKGILPAWLCHPAAISNDLTHENAPLEEIMFLSSEMKQNLKKMGIESLFPVQKIIIPWILETHANPSPYRPRDICVSAPTGSGKTIAFALPIIEILRKRVKQKIRALVVLPGRELASQVFTVFKSLSKGTNLDCMLLSPNIPIVEEQKHLMKNINGNVQPGIDIIVTTAGRLVEHIHTTKGFCLKSLQFLVIDEADRIMEQIQNDWLYHLENHLQNGIPERNYPLSFLTLTDELCKQPHKLLFSATLSSDPEKLEKMKLFQPKFFTTTDSKPKGNKEQKHAEDLIGEYSTPSQLIEKICKTNIETKPLTLFKLIMENSWKRFLCFTNNNIAAHRLSFVLQSMLGKQILIEELSANLKKNARMEILAKFSAGKINGLVSSDTLARGIDVPNVDVIICYDCPRHIRTYIHRIGRTARAGRSGMAVTMICEEDYEGFNRIITSRGKSHLDEIKVSSEIDEETNRKFSTALKELKNFLKKKKRQQQSKVQRDENTGNARKIAKRHKKKDNTKIGKLIIKDKGKFSS
ncbi:probable ATP-dependent RNA helicase Dbp73D [Lutzomyia longipalpis]|uniref:probable ATP-dependent RNA helicase Dbp73D n=1 Tax=Lutzomyia longipalpis TaxID=7200 RepID=UPI00248410F4|nr:probable ATP-dependent RNA helicase Dbp73D [Lutzomyia longipalpis]